MILIKPIFTNFYNIKTNSSSQLKIVIAFYNDCYSKQLFNSSSTFEKEWCTIHKKGFKMEEQLPVLRGERNNLVIMYFYPEEEIFYYLIFSEMICLVIVIVIYKDHKINGKMKQFLKKNSLPFSSFPHKTVFIIKLKFSCVPKSASSLISLQWRMASSLHQSPYLFEKDSGIINENNVIMCVLYSVEPDLNNEIRDEKSYFL